MTASHPAFFDQAPRIRMYEPLARFLGGSADGVYEYAYLDAVKVAGHSCPTVAGAFLMVRAGLKALYGDALPERGGVRTMLPAPADSGVTGVVAGVASLVTGGRDGDGFQGIAGRFNRNGLLWFSADVPGAMAFERVEDGRRVAVEYWPHVVSVDPAMRPLLQACVAGTADPGQQAEFGRLWQDRVRRILVDHADDDEMVRVVGRG